MKLTKKILEYLVYFILLFIPIGMFRDFTPLNELKYLSICNEMINKGYTFILKIHGEIYSDKPPLYFWLINLGKTIFKEHNMFSIALLSIIPSFLIILIMNKWVKNDLNSDESTMGTLMLITTGLFTISSFMIRMDMLMSLFITLSLICFYRVYSNKSKKYEAYLIYLFIFLAIFTKGPMGLIIPVLSILIFLLTNKKVGIIKEIKLLEGLLLLFGLSGIWFSLVYHEGGKEYLYQLVYKQTVNRGIKSFAHARPFYYYFKTIFGSFAPWTFFYLYGIIDSIRNYKVLEKIERFFLIIILTTFIFLSFVSGKLDIYLLPLYCFLPFLSLLRWKKSNNKKKILLISVLPFIIILAIAAIVLPSFAKKSFDIINFTPIISYISSGVFIASIVYFVKENYLKAVKIVYLGFVMLFLFVVANVSEINKSIGLKYLAKTISNEMKDEKYNLYSYQRNEYRNIDVFLKKDAELIQTPEALKQILNKKTGEDSIIIGKTKQINEYKKENPFSSNIGILYSNKTFTIIKINKL